MFVPDEISQIALNNNMSNIAGVDFAVGAQCPVAYLASFRSLIAEGGAYFNGSGILVITKDGLSLSGVNFSGVSVYVKANNVTFDNCYFDASAGSCAVRGLAGTSNLTIKHSTFDGLKLNNINYQDFVSSQGTNTSIEKNEFLNAPTDGISICSGVVTGNYFAGGAYATGAHSDAIWIGGTNGPLTISNNVIDWRVSSDAPTGTNQALRITSEMGNVSDVSVSNNILLGGSYTVLASAGATWTNTAAQMGSMTGVKITNNVIDYGKYGSLNPVSLPADLVYSDNSHADGYPVTPGSEAIGSLPDLSTLNLITAPTATSVIKGSATGNDYIVGGSASNAIYAGAGNDVIDGGAGRDYIAAGTGSSIFLYTSLTNSGIDLISNFKQGQDKIDLVALSGAPSNIKGWQWVGAESFTGHAWQLGYTYSAQNNTTMVQLDANGDLQPDFQLQLSGNIHLKTSDFIIVAADATPPLSTPIVQNTAPTAPTALALDASTDSGKTGDALTNTPAVQIDGSADANSTVNLYDGTTLVGTGTASATGAFAITSTALSNGSHSLAATATNAAGNTSTTSTAITVIVDTAAPTAPTALALDASTDSGKIGDALTNTPAVQIDGSADANSTVNLYDGTTLVGTGTASATGAFAITSTALSNGSHSLAATATNAAGNTSTTSTSLVVNVHTTTPKISGATSVRWYEGSAATHLSKGILTFDDPVPTDHLTTSIAGQSVTYTTASGADMTAGLSMFQIATVEHDFTMPVGDIGSSRGSSTWTYALDDSALSFIGQNDSLKLMTIVEADDGHGGSTSQVVTITLNGINQAPVIAPYASGSTANSGAVTESANGYNSPTTHTASGIFTFNDVDLSDSHGVRVTAKGAGYLGTFVSTVSTDTTGGQVGAVKWAFSATDAVLDSLAVGQTLTQTYAVAVGDGKGGGAIENVTIKLTGAADTFLLQDKAGNIALPIYKAGDIIDIKASAFAGMSKGQLDPNYFTLGSTATASGHGQFLLNGRALMWDADGADRVAPTKVATFASTPTLHNTDFVVI